MERIDYTNSGGGHVRLPQLSLTEEFDAITTRWIDQRSVYTSHESETSTQVAPHQVVYDSLPGYDNYRPEYCGSGLSPGRIGGGSALAVTGSMVASIYRPDYRGETTSNLDYGQDEEIGITGRSLSDSYRPRYGRGSELRYEPNYIKNESPHQVQTRNRFRRLSSQGIAATGPPHEISIESLNFKRLAITPRGARDSPREKRKAINHLQEIQKAENARVERGGREYADFISRSCLPGMGVTKARKGKKKKKEVQPAQQSKQQPDMPAFTIWDEGWLRDEVTNAIDFLASPAIAEMSLITLQYHRRRLKALQLTLEDKERDGVKAQNLAKSQLHIRFFERQLCAKFLEQLALQRDVILASPQQDQQALQRIDHKIRKAEVDLNYALYYPVLEQYDRIFDGTNKLKNLYRAYQPGLGIQVPPVNVKKKYERPELWDAVARCMSEGTVEGLRFARLKRTGRGQITSILEMGTVVTDANMNETKWQVANPADLDVENEYHDDEECGGGYDLAKEDEDSDSDDGGGVRIFDPDVSDSLRHLSLR